MIYKKENKKIIFNSDITTIPDEILINNKDVEEIIIPDNVKEIKDKAFMGCINLKKIKLSNNLQLIGNNIFTNCKSLESITIPSSLKYISNGMFAYCTKLKTININGTINYIDDFAFYNCRKLKEYRIPEETTSIGIKAFFGCNSIKELIISKNLTNIEYAAFAMMSNLEKIIVDKQNPKYKSDENIALFDYENGILIQYAINNKQKEYVVGYFNVTYNIQNEENEEELETNASIYSICDYAFAGSKYLETLYIPSELESISSRTFLNTPKLKTLNIFYSSYGKVLSIHNHNNFRKKIKLPFTTISIQEGITDISNDMSFLFENVENFNLPKTIELIGANTFTKSKKIKKISISKNIRCIQPNSFAPNILLQFEEYGDIPSSQFNMLQTKTSEEYYLKYYKKDNRKIISFTNGDFIVKLDDYEPIKINKQEIINFSNKSELLSENPDDFIKYLIELISLNSDFNNTITKIFRDKKSKELFEKLINDLDIVKEIANKKNQIVINQLLKDNNIKDELLFNGLLMRKLTKEDILLIANNMNESLYRFLKHNHFFDKDNKYNDYIYAILNDLKEVINYTNILEKHKIYDRFLYNPLFYKIHIEYQELLISNYNQNIKRVIKNSKVLESSLEYNLIDLIKFMIIMGSFSKDKITSQKSLTFIADNLFNEDEYQIIGDMIHTIFNEISFNIDENINLNETYDLEFIQFFKENYKELIKLEKENSGIITRIINSFKEIKESSSSHKGEQRHLKVTLNKCLDFFLISKFDEYEEKDYELAKLLSKYFNEKETLKVALKILKLAEKAPRNIFTEIKTDDENNIIYDMNPEHDLKETLTNGFTYEWLPKQSIENLILGKYAGCCAHLVGNGAGIMRASMILDNVQNLVIKNPEGKIIGKMTLYIDRLNGYGVYNTAEININYRKIYEKEIYETFKLGTLAFIKEYNKNNKIKLRNISIGNNRNYLIDQMANDGYDEKVLYPCIDYSKYSYIIDGKLCGSYPGDSQKEQTLIYKKGD